MRTAEQLSELGEAEVRVHRLEEALAEISRRAGTDRELSALEGRAGTLEADLKSTVAQLRALELEVGELRERAASHERAIYGGSVRHPDELQRYRHDVAMLRGRISAAEDRELAAMEAQERLEAELAEAREAAAARAEEVALGRQRGARERPLLEAELVAARADRDAIAASVPPAALRTYRRTAARRTPALARVSEGVCGGCRLPVATRLLQEARGGQLVTCENCERILLL